MPSSVIFAALAAAWLVVLVPMFARRRQEVTRTTDSALAARVVRRGSDRPPAAPGGSRHNKVEEPAMADTDTGRYEAEEADFDGGQEDAEWRRVHSDDVRAGRRYRPGRGGFDPEAAALVARAKYTRRQRIVLMMLLAVVATAVAAVFLAPAIWWAHGAADLALAGYLTYLRRQVRIEEDVRSRRLARMSGARERDAYEPEPVDDEHEYPQAAEYDEYDELDEFDEEELDEEFDEPAYTRVQSDDDHRESPRRHEPRPASAANAVVVEIDDEDPMFDELDERTWEPYRRAAGE